jgi:hypothetical protein
MCVGGAGNTLVGAFGYDGGGGSTTTQFYNIEKNEWIAGPFAPGPGRWGMANGSLSHGGKVYCIGGYPTGTAGNKLTVFDFPSATWSDLAPMPGPPRAAAAAAIVGNSLYVFGGNTIWNCDSATDSALRYDIATNTWSGIASMPGARAYFAAWNPLALPRQRRTSTMSIPAPGRPRRRWDWPAAVCKPTRTAEESLCPAVRPPPT